MADDKQRRIADRAHQLWEAAGRPHGQDVEHWLAAERELTPTKRAAKSASTQANEGEGNRTAARAYNKHTTEFAKSGRVAAKAKEAEKALDGPEAKTLKRAEEAGKKRSHGEDPLLRR